jgi:subfamily B ATP-binding cassette protein MsbA
MLTEIYRNYLKFGLLKVLKKKLITVALNNNFSTDNSSGYYNNLISEQSNRYVSCFDTYLKISIKLASAFTFLTISFMLSFQLNLIVICIGILSYIFYFKLSKITINASYKSTRDATHLSNIINQCLQSLEYLKFVNQTKGFNKTLFHLIDNVSKNYKKVSIINKFIHLSIEPIISIILFLVLIIGTRILEIGTSNIFFILLFLYKGLSNLIGLNQKFNGFLVFSGPVNSINKELDKINHLKSNIPVNKNYISFHKKIEIKNLYFNYQNKIDSIFENASIEIYKNKLTCITGISGVGKSTILKILSLSIKPNISTNLIDGKKIDNFFDNYSWGKEIGYLSQNLYVYSESIYNNITFNLTDSNNSELNLKKVRSICKNLELDDFIESLPNKYNQNINELGSNFSKGQIQRILLARELYKNPQILFLDEPTSALDEKNRKIFSKIINNYKNYMTIIMISHDKNMLEFADIVFEVKNKKIMISNGNI